MEVLAYFPLIGKPAVLSKLILYLANTLPVLKSSLFKY